MSFRLIAADLDDTLLNDEAKISVRTRQAIRQAVDRGILFVIATGRMYRTSVPFVRDLGLHGDVPMINCHGALVKMSSSEEVILRRPLLMEMAAAVVDVVEENGCYASLFSDDVIYIKEEGEHSRFYSQLADVKLQITGDLQHFLQSGEIMPDKISVICPEGSLDKIASVLNRRFGDKLSMLQARPFFLDITDQKATKGQALCWLAGIKGIKQEEILAFGDGHNDLDMVGYAGLGVAVANAKPELLKAADLVTADNSRDGVAVVIEKYILNHSTYKTEGFY
ncbi:MAG: Cof-type HAD-IIB family hydrolase [Bacillota bacterium]|nr:Cof-type HAD-IIB family hydrolase [Bacillota bacterium]